MTNDVDIVNSRSAMFLDDLRRLLQCPKCYLTPMALPIYVCEKGHSLCSDCHAKLIQEALAGEPGRRPRCSICRSEVSSKTRNLLVERMIEHLGPQLQGDTDSETRLFAVGDLACPPPPPGAPGVVDEAPPPPDRPNTMMASHRPIRCPKTPCHCTVAVASMLAHFSFDHPDVTLLPVDPGRHTRVWIAPNSIPMDVSLCVAVLLLSGKGPRVTSCSSLTPNVAVYRDRLPLPLLTARCRLAGADCLLMWLADVEPGIYYTLTASDQSYRTPVAVSATTSCTSLRAPQTPRDVFATGKCLVVHQPVLETLSANGGFDITLVIH